MATFTDSLRGGQVSGPLTVSIGGSTVLQLQAPSFFGITAADIAGQLRLGNNTSDAYNFSPTSAVLYVSNAFPTAVSTGNKAAVFKVAQTTTSNFATATYQGVVGYGRADSVSFNAGFIYGAQFQAQSNQLGGSVESLIGNNGIANFTSTHQGNVTLAATGLLGTGQANATGASATGTLPVLNGVQGQVLKSTADKLTVTEANGLLSGGHLLNSTVGTFYGIHFKEDTGIGTITTEYGLYIDAVTRGSTSVGAYIGGGTTWGLWVDSGITRLDGDLDHRGTNVGFFGVTPVARASAYSITNVTPDRAYDANATTTDELADVLGTLIADLKLYGLLQ